MPPIGQPPHESRTASSSDPMEKPFYKHRWPYVVLGAAMLIAVASGVVLGRVMRFDLPDVRALEDYNPPVMTSVLARDASLVESFAEERRILIEYRDVPQAFLQALIATEDSNFYRHPGFDLKGIVRALWSDVRHMEMKQGASTLTQQLARNLFLHRDKTIRRKLQEVVLALEIERQYTKQEILHFYCNQIYMGHGRYGLEAASGHYFGKTANDLTLTEAATLAGLIQRPEVDLALPQPAAGAGATQLRPAQDGRRGLPERVRGLRGGGPAAGGGSAAPAGESRPVFRRGRAPLAAAGIR